MKFRFFASAGAVALAAASQAVLVMDQLGPNFTFTDAPQVGRASQDFEAANNAFDVAMIDDFNVSASTLQLNQVQVAIGLFGGVTPLHSNITAYRVEIYTSVAAAAANLVGNAGSQTVASGGVTTDLTGYTLNAAQPRARVTIPINIVLGGAGTYWIGVIPVFNFGGGAGFGQSGVIDSSFAGSPGGLNNFQVNPAGGFAIPGGANRLNNSGYQINAVPEPASMAALGLGALALIRRRRSK